jgi:formylmethanofuran dehydrogenase subunit D
VITGYHVWEVVIPPEIHGIPVTKIGKHAFAQNQLTNVTIPDSVIEIGDHAFAGNHLTSITIPDSVTSIGDYAFAGNPLTSVTIPDRVTSIGDHAFYDCKSLASITIGKSVTFIGNSAFSGCKNLTSIAIPDSVTSIEYYAFSGCSSLASITVDSDNPNYASEGGILYNKAKTEIVYVPPEISGNVTIPDSVTSIGNWTFRDCTSLASVTIGKSVTTIGDSAFKDCRSLASITVDSDNPNYSSEGGILYNKAKIEIVYVPRGISGNVTIPDSIATIWEYAFYGCTSLTSITVDSDNPNYSSEGGILYNRAKTKIVCVPRGISGNVTIPDIRKTARFT